MDIRILVVDNSVSDRLTIKNKLRQYCVLTASDGVEAMRILEAVSYTHLDVYKRQLLGYLLYLVFKPLINKIMSHLE